MAGVSPKAGMLVILPYGASVLSHLPLGASCGDEQPFALRAALGRAV